MHTVLRFGMTGTEDIVEVDEREIKILEDRVHESLERLCCILYAEGNAEQFPHINLANI